MTTSGQDKDSACAYLRYKMTYLKWATYTDTKHVTYKGETFIQHSLVSDSYSQSYLVSPPLLHTHLKLANSKCML